MALTWTAKPVGAVYRYTWTPPLAEGDTLDSYTVTETGAVIDSEEQLENSVALFISGGTAGDTASFVFSGVSKDGETLTETVYLPIVDQASIGTTGEDIARYALRKIVGIGETPAAEYVEDAIERLNDMLRVWTDTGANVGNTFPVTTATVFNIRDTFLAAIKANLLVNLCEHYGEPITGKSASDAIRGLQLVKMANLSDDREGAEYY
jgi:hypothetical protein